MKLKQFLISLLLIFNLVTVSFAADSVTGNVFVQPSVGGAASFNTTNLPITGGEVNTAQGISTAATPTFAGIISGPSTLNGTVSTESAQLGAEFLSGTGWTSTGWTGSWATGWTHTTGNTTVLSQSSTPTAATLYSMVYTITGRTAGSITITFGGNSISGIYNTNGWGKTTATTGNLTITPTTDFNGTIVISIKPVTGTSNPVSTFKSLSGDTISEIRVNNYDNYFNGYQSGGYCTFGSADNMGYGYQCLKYLTSGIDNIGYGWNAGSYLSDMSSYNETPVGGLYLGAMTMPLADAGSNETIMGNYTAGHGSNTVTIGNSVVTDNYFNGNLRASTIIGGTGTTSDLTLQTTSGVGTTGADMHFLVGNNGRTEAATILNSGNVGIGTTSPLTKLNIVDTISTSPRGILSSQFSTDTNGARLGLYKYRGTEAAPTTIVTGDSLGMIMFGGYDGVNLLEMASIKAGSSGTIAATRVPSYLSFSTATDALPSVLTERIRIDNAGILNQKSNTALESAPLGAELLSASNWTSTGWTGSWGIGWTHTVGNTTALSNTLVAVTNSLYQVTYTVTGRTAGTFTIAFGGASITTLSATGAWGPKATSTGSLSITPTTDFDGTIVISIKQITGVYNAIYAIQDNLGNNTYEMRISLSTLYNTNNGKDAGRSNTTGTGNTNSGVSAGFSNTTGTYNTNSGVSAGRSNTTGTSNTNSGVNAGFSNTTGTNNTNSGVNAGFSNTTGTGNTNNGKDAGRYLTDGTTPNINSTYSLFLGNDTRAFAASGNNEIVIGSTAIGAGSNTVTLGNTSITNTVLRGTITDSNYGAGAATFDASGNISSSSDERLKNIQGNFTAGLAELMNIQPINYKWNNKSGLDQTATYTGFSAQNVKKYIPEAVGKNADGYYSINDRPIIAALVNAIKDLQMQIDVLKKVAGIKVVTQAVTPIADNDNSRIVCIDAIRDKSIETLVAEKQAAQEAAKAEAEAKAKLNDNEGITETTIKK
jgi:hypothetical protein